MLNTKSAVLNRATVAVWSRGAVLTFLVVFSLALIPRVTSLRAFLTPDEADFWINRSQNFLEALKTGNFVETYQSSHPGVMTMWLGTLGELMRQTLSGMSLVSRQDILTTFLFMRLPLAITTALTVALAYLLLRRLLDQRVALLAALFWAMNPLLIAYGKILHVDGMLMCFVNLSILAALVACGMDESNGAGNRPIRWGMLVASGVAGGLAFLSKIPAVILLPVIVLIVLFSRWRTVRFEYRLIIRLLVVWGGVALITWLALWPATWVDLPGTVYKYLRTVYKGSTASHEFSYYFFGQIVPDRGPLFYPLTIVMGLTPWATIGLIAALAAALSRNHKLRGGMVLGILVLFVLLFMVMMSVPSKKGARYLLPIYPALDIFAAFGLIWLFDVLRRRTAVVTAGIAKVGKLPAKIWNAQWTWVLVIIGLSANIAWYHPFELAYGNPLLGGGPTADHIYGMGWGLGLEHAGAYISAQPDGCARPVASWYPKVLSAYACTTVVALDDAQVPGEVGYVVLYNTQIRRNLHPEITDLLWGKVQPVYVVNIHGIDYAYVYRMTPSIVRQMTGNPSSNEGYAEPEDAAD